MRVHLHFHDFDESKVKRVKSGTHAGEFTGKGGSAEARQAPKVVRFPGSKKWGTNRPSSTLIAGESAKLMGIPGYKTVADPSFGHSKSFIKREQPENIRHAKHFLRAIKNSPGSDETLYHAFANKRNVEYKIGNTIKKQLIATAATSQLGYGQTRDPKDQVSETTVFVFPKGTKIAGYDKLKPAEEKEFGYKWEEAITAGEFKVTKVKQVQGENKQYPKHREVTLKQTAYFDPDTETWVKL